MESTDSSHSIKLSIISKDTGASSSDDDFLVQESETPLPPFHDHNHVDSINPHQPVELEWNNLSYEIKSNFWQLNRFKSNVPQKRHLLNSLNGSIRTNEIMALIGPSGSGKTTLLECISGRRPKSLITGTIEVKSTDSMEHVRIAYMSHEDTMMMNLTVQETLMFASKLRINEKKNISDYKHLVNNIIHQLSLEQYQNIKVCHCSNGQQKRLCIALKLIYSPTILLLDEPTSGLDSASCLQCIRLLRQLTEDRRHPIAILVSIHQPTASLLKYFHQLYVLTMNGQCIFRGPQSEMVSYLNNFDLHCPNYHNPADFIVEIGIGNYGDDAIKQLVLASKMVQLSLDENNNDDQIVVPIEKIVDQSRKNFRNNIYTFFNHFILLSMRCLLLQYRDPSEFFLRILGTLAVVFVNWIIYRNSHLGRTDGCFRSHVISIIDTFNNKSSQSNWNEQAEFNMFNYGFLFYTSMFISFVCTMPIILTFPTEMQVINRELSHGWYGLPVYFMAKNISNLILPMMLPLFFGAAVYTITEQPFELWRFGYFLLTLTLIALVGDGCGQLISALFIHSINEATIFAAITQLGLVLFSGLFVQNSTLPNIVRHFTYISHYRLCFESLIIILYGYGRCNDHGSFPVDMKLLVKYFSNNKEILECIQDTNEFQSITEQLVPIQKQISKNPSVTMENFNLRDYDLQFNLLLLILYIFFYRILAYVILYYKIRKN